MYLGPSCPISPTEAEIVRFCLNQDSTPLFEEFKVFRIALDDTIICP